MAKDKLITLGDLLEIVMEKTDSLKAELKVLEEEEDRLRELATQELVKKNRRDFSASSGLRFILKAGRISYKVKKGQEFSALQWAIKEYPGVLTIAAAKFNNVVMPMLQPPEFAERVEQPPHISLSAQEAE